MVLEKAYTRTQLGTILVSAMLGYATDGYNLLILSFVMPALRTDLGLSGGQAGLVVSAQLLASVVGGVLFGRFADRRGRKAGLFWSIMVFSVGALLSGFAWDFSSLLALRFLTGIGLGGEWGVGMALFNEAWSRHRGLGSGIIGSCLPMGSVAAGIVAAGILSAQGAPGWRWALATGAVPVLLCVFVRLRMPESKLWQEFDRNRRLGATPVSAGTDGGSSARPGVGALLRPPNLRRWVLGFALVAGYMVAYYGLTSFMPSLVAVGYHQSASVWSAVNTFAVWVVVPVKIGFGLWGDRIGRRIASLVPTLLLLAASLGFVWLSWHPGVYPGSIWTWSVFWLFFVWSAGTSCSSLFGAWLSESFPTEVRATAVSTTYMFGRGLAALGPVVVPLIAPDNLARGMGLVSTAGALLFIVAALLLPETKGRALPGTAAVLVSEPRR